MTTTYRDDTIQQYLILVEKTTPFLTHYKTRHGIKPIDSGCTKHTTLCNFRGRTLEESNTILANWRKVHFTKEMLEEFNNI